MYSIEEIKKKNEAYDKESEKLKALYEEVKECSNSIDLEEIENTLDYAGVKELYMYIQFRGIDKAVLKEIENIKDSKKVKEYPMINEVRYYPTINEIEGLDREEKIILDRKIEKAYKNRRFERELTDLDSELIEALISKDILEKKYVFSCNCHSFDCDELYKSEKEVQELKEYWNKEKNGEDVSFEEMERLHYGCFEIPCWNDSGAEVSDLESFNENLRLIEYRVKTKPDRTLDNI